MMSRIAIGSTKQIAEVACEKDQVQVLVPVKYPVQLRMAVIYVSSIQPVVTLFGPVSPVKDTAFSPDSKV